MTRNNYETVMQYTQKQVLRTIDLLEAPLPLPWFANIYIDEVFQRQREILDAEGVRTDPHLAGAAYTTPEGLTKTLEALTRKRGHELVVGVDKAYMGRRSLTYCWGVRMTYHHHHT